MPHSKTGREVKIGDKLVTTNQWGHLAAGTVIAITEGAQTCNAQLVPTGIITVPVTLSECLHADDLSDFKT